MSGDTASLRRVAARYALFQLPELVIASAVLLLLVRLELLTPGWGWASFGLWLLKEAALFPLLRRAYEPSDPSGAARLVGVIGIATGRLDPQGTVRIGAELWTARLASGSRPVEPGERVCVKAVEGLTLHVEEQPFD
jgi:membrane protein implicated in regulation of membrane protease activity